MIFEPARDVFITTREDPDNEFFYSCAAEGNPTPLVRWYRDDVEFNPNSSKPFEITITMRDLGDQARNVFVCVARNRQGNSTRTVSIVVRDENIDPNDIDQTNEQINIQENLDATQATNLAELVDTVLVQNSMVNETVNGTSNGTILPASILFRNVVDRWDQNVRNNDDMNENQVLFNTNTELIRSTQPLQNGTTGITPRQVRI